MRWAITSAVLPQEILALIAEHLGSSGGIVSARREFSRGSLPQMQEWIRTMKRQIILIYRTVEDYNPRFWHSLIHHPNGRIACSTSVLALPNSFWEVDQAVGCTYAAW
jgi:hypothetical protein